MCNVLQGTGVNLAFLCCTYGAAKCPIPRLMNGNLVCRSDVSTFTCSIKCNPGYFISNRTITDDLICSDEQWNKNITEEFEGLTCISLIGGSVQGSIGVTARKTCKGKVGHNLNYTEKILKSQFDVAYRLNTGGFDIRFAVVATCPSNSGQSKTHLSHSDLHLAIFVSGDYRDDDEKRKLKEVIDDILKDIERNMITGFLVVRVNDGQMFRDAAIDTGTGPQNISYTDDCPAGTFNDSMKCTVCPAGTYQTASACTVCPLGTYNDKERQIECTPCPAGERTSGTGSYIKDQCKGLQTPSEFTNDPGQSSTSLITIIACAAGAIIVILVIVIIVVTVKNRSRNKSYDAGGAISTQKHANACYNDSSADIYDDIHDTPPPSQASAPPGAEVYTGAAAQPNHYESLDEAKKAGETYDQISLKDEK